MEQVITGCAACYKTLKVEYPKLLNKSLEDLGFKVVHTTELLEQLVKEGRLEFRELETRVTYHDPCQLGRLSELWIHWEGKCEKFGILNPPKRFRHGTYGIYDAPRNILKNIPGLKLVVPSVRKTLWMLLRRRGKVGGL